MRYCFNIADNKVVCVSHYAGKAVRGIAKCDTDYDSFEEEYGCDLAQARCDVKVSEKRLKRAQLKAAEAREALERATTNLRKMNEYVSDSLQEYDAAITRLHEVETQKK